VLPYVTLKNEGFESVSELLFGHGAGSADRRAQQSYPYQRQLFSTMLKLYWEYGAVATVAFLSLLVRIVSVFAPEYRPIACASALQYLLLTGSLVFAFMPALLLVLALSCQSTTHTHRTTRETTSVSRRLTLRLRSADIAP
jgi:hypothetical protein